MTDLATRIDDVRTRLHAAIEGAQDVVTALAAETRIMLQEADHIAEVAVMGAAGTRSIAFVNGIWSPSLHPISGKAMTLLPEMGSDFMIETIAGPIARQMRACEDARRMGIAWRNVREGTPIDHLHVDRFLLDAMGGDAASRRTRTRDIVLAIHPTATGGYDGHGFFSMGQLSVREVEDGTTTLRVLSTRIPIQQDRWCTFDGNMLDLPDDGLPDTVLDAMRGRPLGDLAAVHPLLDGRVVTDVHRMTPTSPRRLGIVLAPDRVRLADVH